MSKILTNNSEPTNINENTYLYNTWIIPSDITETNLTGNTSKINDTFSDVMDVAKIYQIPIIICIVTNNSTECRNLESLLSLSPVSDMMKSYSKKYLFVLCRNDSPDKYNIGLTKVASIKVVWYKDANTIINKTIVDKHYSVDVTIAQAREIKSAIDSELSYGSCSEYRTPQLNGFMGKYITNQWMTNTGDGTPRYSKVFSANEQHTVLVNVLNYA